jgi:MFS family permease
VVRAGSPAEAWVAARADRCRRGAARLRAVVTRSQSTRPHPAARAPRLDPARFVVAFGFVSALGDIVYEGARSVLGPWLGSLGATAATIGLLTGLGEATALVLRLASGPLADRTRRYWLLAFTGYALTFIAVPLMALAGTLTAAAVLVLAERLGKAIRAPSRDAMLAEAGTSVGQGRAFALHEAMDQTGAFTGPLVVAVMVALGGYGLGFGVLAVPAAAAVGLLTWLRRAVPDPAAYGAGSAPAAPAGRPGEPAAAPPAARGDVGPLRLSPAFWRYTAFSALAMLGFATFPVLGFHLVHRGVLPAGLVPVVYATAMGADAVAALASGRSYDRRGLRALVVLPVLAAAVPWLAFSTTAVVAWAGAIAWGAALGVQESTMRAAVADLAPQGRRGTAYGTFTASYGVAWLGGSTLVGVLYDVSTTTVALAVTAIEAAALVLFVAVVRRP